jgi:hypothetical protein
LVTPITIETLHRFDAAPDENHFLPEMTYESPSRRIDVSMFVASELATAGSVIEKHDRISPSSKGISHRSVCSGVPNM